MSTWGRKVKVGTLYGLVVLALVIVIGSLGLIFFDIIFNGIKSINATFLKGVIPILMNTLQLVFFSLLFSVPIALMAVLYLVEYAKSEGFVRIIRFASGILAGVPSIIYGLVGMGLFVRVMGFGLSLYAGSLTVALLILPMLIRMFEDAIKAVPSTYKSAALSLGASQLRALFTVVLPASRTSLLSAIMLALGRVVGETAALILTLGTANAVIKGIWDSGRTLSINMFVLAKESVSLSEAYASALVLLLAVFLINTLANLLTGGKEHA
ncbi:phosphate ABC transporter permease PstA [Entomospira culicis]|uniref:Phosphate transport system permease protein PstA n=1 Tax=Entomospira culicis TaxID=2719989 RepID=A0A968GFI7_9SPIO|nr:phosphate ABC transporter permease PstA [Entomospira culicis]NIZ19143.1 phosphate ABC transporter permease PstA [Entomospira culicis]NIZ69357.1 phosphate ABC transporter permease PstA [Entomospira culicis]WDI37942.1 phosphate ABC transporter permease PstA [Entomospira culicis]WDI39570.1 phosphate ABC transporter permease PstA [Entomospira culicis]